MVTTGTTGSVMRDHLDLATVPDSGSAYLLLMWVRLSGGHRRIFTFNVRFIDV